MANLDGSVGSGPARVNVRGLNRAVRKLQAVGADAQDLKELMHSIGMIVVRAASAPVDSGMLTGTIRAGKGKTKAVVRAGGARAPYAGVVHYGNPNTGTKSNPFLVSALQKERADVLTALETGIDQILIKNDLK